MLGIGNKFIFLYGAFYDPEMENPPAPGERDVVVYRNLRGETGRSIASLEGVFICDGSSGGDPFKSFGALNPICTREEMRDFEEEYKGEFRRF